MNTPHAVKPIALIGMMGTGKTTLGRLLAQRLGLDFIDTDDMIESRQGKTIAAIFAQDGEAAFRRLESDIIAQAIETHPGSVIGTGGGAVTTPETLNKLVAGTTLCWLKSSPESIFERIKKDPARPLLQTLDPLAALKSLLEARKDLYAQAHHHVDLNDENPLETLDKLVTLLGNKEG